MMRTWKNVWAVPCWKDQLEEERAVYPEPNKKKKIARMCGRCFRELGAGICSIPSSKRHPVRLVEAK